MPIDVSETRFFLRTIMSKCGGCGAWSCLECREEGVESKRCVAQVHEEPRVPKLMPDGQVPLARLAEPVAGYLTPRNPNASETRSINELSGTKK